MTFRVENQPADAIRFFVEVVEVGVPVIGLTPRLEIIRIADNELFNEFGGPNFYWNSGDAVDMVPNADFPGLYQFQLPADAIDFPQHFQGYLFRIRNGSVDGEDEFPLFTEHGRVHVVFTGEQMFRMIALRQKNMRLTNATFHSSGQPETGTITVYRTAADASADQNALGTYDFTVTYNGDGTVASYVSTETT